MDISQTLGQYGALGVICGLLLWWAYKLTMAESARRDAQTEWIQAVLVALVKDATGVLVEVREAIRRAPCGSTEDGQT